MFRCWSGNTLEMEHRYTAAFQSVQDGSAVKLLLKPDFLSKQNFCHRNYAANSTDR
jgi:hypothetical protein